MAGRLRPLIPDIAFRTGWSSSAFLLYAGAYVIAASVVSLAAGLGDRSDVGDLKLVLFTGLLVILLAIVANALRRTGDRVPAGLFAVIALVMFGIWVGVTESWLGLWPDDTESFVPSDFEVGTPLLTILLVAAGLGEIQLFRFPLLVLPTAVAAWYGLVYLIVSAIPGSPEEDAHGMVALLVGLALVAAGIALDRLDRRPYAFWLHVVGGLAVLGGLVAMLHEDAWEWVLVGLVSVGYVVAAEVLGRSSYTVLGAGGFVFAGTYLIDKWLSSPPDFLLFPFPLAFFYLEAGGGGDGWSGATATAVLGGLLFVGGLGLERGWWLRRRSAAP
jgi:hypothetical protein